MHQVKKAGQPAAQYLLSLPQAFSVSPSTGISQEKTPQKRKDQKLHHLQADMLLDRWCMINQALRDQKLLERPCVATTYYETRLAKRARHGVLTAPPPAAAAAAAGSLPAKLRDRA